MKDPKLIEVAGVAIINSDHTKILAAKRDDNRSLAGYWEFPGGKIEEGETARQAAIRELEEEFDDQVQLGKLLGKARYNYNFGIVELTVFFAKLLTHNFDLVAHSKIEWLSIEWLSTDQIQNFNWAPADLPIVKKLAQVDLKEIKFNE